MIHFNGEYPIKWFVDRIPHVHDVQSVSNYNPSLGDVAILLAGSLIGAKLTKTHDVGTSLGNALFQVLDGS